VIYNKDCVSFQIKGSV